MEDLFKTGPAEANKCWGYKPNYAKCDDNVETECIGTEFHNYIYEIMLPGKLTCFNSYTILNRFIVFQTLVLENMAK